MCPWLGEWRNTLLKHKYFTVDCVFKQLPTNTQLLRHFIQKWKSASPHHPQLFRGVEWCFKQTVWEKQWRRLKCIYSTTNVQTTEDKQEAWLRVSSHRSSHHFCGFYCASGTGLHVSTRVIPSTLWSSCLDSCHTDKEIRAERSNMQNQVLELSL